MCAARTTPIEQQSIEVWTAEVPVDPGEGSHLATLLDPAVSLPEAAIGKEDDQELATN